MSFLSSFQQLPAENAYFAALNHETGFRSYFTPLFEPYRKFVIKGGPGTGKSTLMKKIAARGEELGLPVERYYCSSDTSSLDGVALPTLSLVVLDGTAPHTVEPERPGAVDRLLDLGAFWQRDSLRADEPAITQLNAQIAVGYRQVYTLMSAVARLEEAARQETAALYKEEKAEAILRRFLSKRRLVSGGKQTVRPIAAFGTQGPVMFETNRKLAQTVVALPDTHGASPFFFRQLADLLSRRGIAHRIAPLPLTGEIGEILLPDASLLFTALPCDAPTVTLNPDRMLTDRGRGILRRTRSYRHASHDLRQILCKKLASIGRWHDELEEYYIKATDFPAIDRFTEDLLEEIFG